MSDKPKIWLTIIPPMPGAEFDAFLKRWRDENKDSLALLDPARFEVDVLRDKDGKSQRRLRLMVS